MRMQSVKLKKGNVPNESVLDLATVSDVMWLLNRGKQTIQLWRRDRGLPYIRVVAKEEGGRDTIRFDLHAVREWAKKDSWAKENGVTVRNGKPPSRLPQRRKAS